jgi:hypothetical protein
MLHKVKASSGMATFQCGMGLVKPMESSGPSNPVIRWWHERHANAYQHHPWPDPGGRAALARRHEPFPSRRLAAVNLLGLRRQVRRDTAFARAGLDEVAKRIVHFESAGAAAPSRRSPGADQVLSIERCQRPQPGGLPEGSRGLSVSDTPGRRARKFRTPAGVPEAGESASPSGSARPSHLFRGGVVAVLLNPRLPSAIAPRCRTAARTVGCSRADLRPRGP